MLIPRAGRIELGNPSFTWKRSNNGGLSNLELLREDP